MVSLARLGPASDPSCRESLDRRYQTQPENPDQEPGSLWKVWLGFTWYPWECSTLMLSARNIPRRRDKRGNTKHKSTTRPQSDRGGQLSKASAGRGSGGNDRFPAPEQWQWHLPG